MGSIIVGSSRAIVVVDQKLWLKDDAKHIMHDAIVVNHLNRFATML